MNDIDSDRPAADPAARRQLHMERLAMLRDLLPRDGAKAVLLDSRADFAWLTVGGLNHVDGGDKKGAAPILVTRDAAAVLAPTNERDRIAAEEVAGLDLEVVGVPWWVPSRQAASELEIGRGLAIADATQFADALQGLRTRLASVERSRMEWLASVVRRSVDEALAGVRGGETEDDVAAELHVRFARVGARLPVVLVAGDERIARYRHPLPSAATFRNRVMVVVVAEAWGVHVAHTQFVELAPLAADVAFAADASRRVAQAMRAATRVGATLGDVFKAAQAAYAEAGLDEEWKLHHQGGSIGYQPRERIATPGDRTLIEAGMAFAWNPSVTGYKVEETMYLDDVGSTHVLTSTP